MKTLLIIILCCIFLLLYILLKKLNKNLLITLLCSITILYIILKPKLCINAALAGVKLFLYAVFPSLFPFLVIINIILSYGGVHIYSTLLGNILCKPLRLPKQCSLVLIISALCGYPLGARYACSLYEKQLIDFDTCERLINIASNASPLFIIGTVGASMLNNSALGYLLLLANYLSCAVMGLILPINSNKWKNPSLPRTTPSTTPNIGIAFKEGVEDAVKTSLSIGGFIIIFSVIMSIIKDNAIFNIVLNKLSSYTGISYTILEGSSLGLIEMTNGCALLSSNTINIYTQLIIISFMIAFSGLSIISQVYSFTYKYNFSLKKYIKRKCLQGFFASLLSIGLYKVIYVKLSSTTFNVPSNNSSELFFLIAIVLLLLPACLGWMFQLFHTS